MLNIHTDVYKWVPAGIVAAATWTVRVW